VLARPVRFAADRLTLRRRTLGVVGALAVLAMLVAGCARGPRPLAYGRAECDFCRMRIDDPRFGGEVVTAHGRTLQFDAIECTAGYVRTLAPGTEATVWVADFEHPGTLIPAATARFLQGRGGAGVGTPMGRGIIAVQRSADVAALQRRLGGATELTWSDVLRIAPAEASSTVRDTATTPTTRGDAAVVTVSPSGAVRTITGALARVARGGTIVVMPGTYREPTIVVNSPVTIIGRGAPVLDGENARQIMTVKGDSVTVRGLVFRNVGLAFTEDLAAIKVVRAHDCDISDNRIENGFFGIYLQEAVHCTVRRNELRATRARDSESGNGIHLWHARDITIEDNHVTGHRDGIYFEFVREAHVRHNVSERNLRYGLHFMYSDSCDYERNTFHDNGAGVAVMYTHVVHMTGNRFEDNRSAAAYGLLLKEIADAELTGNVFARNTTGLMADAATNLIARGNDFEDNGWALRLEASTDNATFADNDFVGNTFDVATNSRSTDNAFRHNYWSSYDGYDLNHDGVGDVPYRPVRLSSVVVAQDEPALILLRSTFLAMLDAAERVLPALTPESLADSTPAMRWNR